MQPVATRKKPLLLRPEVLGLLAIALCAELGVAVLNISAMPVYLTQSRHFSEAFVGVALGAFLLSEAVFKSYSGALADKFGRRPFLIGAPCIWIFTPLLTLWVPESWGAGEFSAILLLRVFDGVAAAMLWPSAYAAMAEAVEEHEKGKAIAMLNACFMLGLALGLPLGGIANEQTGQRSASFFLASGLFLLTVIGAIAFSRRQYGAGTRHFGHSDHLFRDLAMCVKTVPMIFVTALVIFVGVGLPMAIVKLFAQQAYDLDEQQFGLLVLPAALVMAFLSGPMGAWGEKIGRDRSVRVGLLLCAIGVWLVALGDWVQVLRSLFVVGGASMMVGVGFLLALPAWYASVSAINPQRAGSYLGAVMSVQGLGAIIGIVAGSRLFSIDIYLPFTLCALAVTAGFILSIFTIQAPKSPEQV